MSKIDLVYAPASRVKRWNGLQLLLRATQALLHSMQDSRERAARNIIRDLIHLPPEQDGANSSQEGRKGMARESQVNLKRME